MYKLQYFLSFIGLSNPIFIRSKLGHFANFKHFHDFDHHLPFLHFHMNFPIGGFMLILKSFVDFRGDQLFDFSSFYSLKFLFYQLIFVIFSMILLLWHLAKFKPLFLFQNSAYLDDYRVLEFARAFC